MNDYGDSTMTFHNAKGLRPIRRPTLNRIGALGVALMLACGHATAAAPTGAPAAAAATPVSAPASLSVAKIDFKRGEDGAGRLVLQFDGQGANPDLRNQGSNVVVDVGNATLPASLQRPLNVVDFATPVQRVEAQSRAGGTQLVLSTRGDFESLAYQSGNEYVVEITPSQGVAATGTALFASLMLSQAPAQANGLDDIVARGTLKVAVPQDFPPFGSVGPDMKPRGLDIDTAKLLADQLKVKLELTPVNSTNRIPFLTTGKVDLVISSLGKNPEREAVIDFSSAYAPFYLGVFGPEDAAVSSLADLEGKTISVTRGAVEDIELSKVAPKGATLKRFEDNNSTIAAYLSGQVDLIASGNVVMVAISERNPKRVPSMKLKLKDSPVYVGVNKNQSALLDKVNSIITAAKADGSLDTLSQKWLKQPLPAGL